MINYRSIITIIICLVVHNALAQIRTIIPVSVMTTNGSGDWNVALNSEKVVSNLKFDLSSLPANAQIDRVVLRLVLKKSSSESVRIAGKCINRTDDVTIRNQNTRDYKNYDDIELSNVDSRRFAKVLEDSIKAKSITIQVFTQEQNAEYSICDMNFSEEYTRMPRLVIYYRPEPDPAQWAGYKADAQHTSALAATFGPDTSSVTSYESVNPPGGSNISKMVFDDDRIFYITTENQNTALNSLDPVTRHRKLLSSVSPPTMMPVISPDGYYYNVTTDNIYPIKIADGSAGRPIRTDAIKAPPTAGRDGSLYICDRSYIKAYTPQPTNTLIWQYSLGNSVSYTINASSVSLSTDDSFAYVVVTSDIATFLLRINTLTKRGDTVLLRDKITPLADKSIPPMVINKNNYVYYTYPNEKMLRIYDKSLKLTREIKADRSINQPVISGNDAYVVVDGRKILRLNNDAPVDSLTINDCQVKYMITDKNDDLYIMTEDNLLSSYSFSRNGRLCSQVQLRPTILYMDIIMAADGVVYYNTRDNIWGLRPRTFSIPTYEVTNETLRAGYTYRANKITFKQGEKINRSSKNIFVGNSGIDIMKNVTFESNTSTVLETGKGAIIQNGFVVKNNAIWSLKTGY